MIRWVFGALIVAVTSIVAISLFLAPDGLLRCSESPSAIDGCEQADVIIAVSGGDTSGRTQHAINLYQSGWADSLIFSGAASDTSGPSNAEVMRSQALDQGVPASAITIEDDSKNTAENAVNTKDILDDENINSAIIVTSSYHAKRTLLEFRERAPSIDLRMSPTPSDRQWSAWWWTTPQGWYLAGSELVKIGIVYMGGTR